jgi:4-diphosphocytidyl-2-C-methyl-D-erythritol kinase
MISFPNCKINLGLNIIHKRGDGYHDLETVFYPIMIKDVLEVVVETTDDRRQPTNFRQQITVDSGELTVDRPQTINFTSSGLLIDGDISHNLCVKAYQLLKKNFPQLPAVQMHLHKAIPMGAGLGGGSADGAFALKLLNDKFQLGLSQQQLINYALQLGSDCPFFILNKPCFATSRGEVMNEMALDLSAYQFVIVNPGIHVNTGWAFANITPAKPAKSIATIIQQPIETWKDELVNDFEAPVAKAHPEIASIKQALYNTGAIYASMSGSGSTVFGLFKKSNTPMQFQFPSLYFLAHC